MKIALQSNYDKFSKRLIDLGKYIDDGTAIAVQEVLEAMCEDMKAAIQNGIQGTIQEGSGLDSIRQSAGEFDDIEYETDGVQGTIYIGRNTPLLRMKDDRTVNPYLFIQFGYGIKGEESPIRYHQFNRWEYNVNNHTEAWWYWGTNGDKIWDEGRIGIDFFYTVIDKYRSKWKEIAKQAILKFYNRG